MTSCPPTSREDQALPAWVRSVRVGRVADLAYGGGTVRSGIVKAPVAGPLRLGPLGFDGDEQGDRTHHGGPDKAVCVYPREHYPYWSGRLARPVVEGEFGENLTTAGLLETQVALGETYRVGTALVQVVAPRRPCYRLGAHLHEARVPGWVQETGRTGFYLRVLEPGLVAAHDRLVLLDRPADTVSVAEVNRVMNLDRLDLTAAAALADLELVPARWRQVLAVRVARGGLDDEVPAARLEGPAGR